MTATPPETEPSRPAGSPGRRGRSRWLRWIVGPLITLLAASFLISGAIALSPGDPVSQLLGPRPSQERYDEVQHQLGLDKPFLQRYASWLGGAVHGDFGESIALRKDTGSLLGPRLGITLFLVLYAALLVIVVGIGLGMVGGGVPRLGPFVAVLSAVGVAVPTFVAAGLLVSLFAVNLGWFPTIGAGSGFLDRLWHLTLPAIALAIAWGAYVAQITRVSIAEERSREHVETARGRGLPPGEIFRRHVLRNAAIPITTVVGLSIAGMLAGAVVVETAFQIDGIGSLLVQSVEAKDQNVVLAISMILVFAFVLVTALVDWAAARLDPRVHGRSDPA